MAGTINFAMTQQFDMDGRPLSGGLLYFFTAGTTTPQSAFQDVALTIAYPNPIVLDASGRVPMFYLADGNIKIRLTDETGVTVIAADNLLVIGPSSGGGGGTAGSVNPTELLATGDIKPRFGTGTLDGFVRCNGNTIGKTGSGATERADTDTCQALFEYLWQFSTITLDTAKGSDAATDFANGRLLKLPDLRGRVIAGMDDMGASASLRLTSLGLGVDGALLGNAGAIQTMTILEANLPAHSHTQQGTHSGSGSGGGTASGTVSGSASGFASFTVNPANTGHSHTWGGSFTTDPESAHTHSYGFPLATGTNALGGATNLSSTTSTPLTTGAGSPHTHGVTVSGTTSDQSVNHVHTGSVSMTSPFAVGATLSVTVTSVSVATTLSGTTTAVGGNTPISKVQPTMVMTFYIKL